MPCKDRTSREKIDHGGTLTQEFPFALRFFDIGDLGRELLLIQLFYSFHSIACLMFYNPAQT